MKYLDIDKNINYRNFGYIPTGKIKRDIVGKLFGFKNLYKRLQAKDTINFMDIKNDERILDYGCGAGYFSIEFAKIAKSVVAIDISDFITKIKVPKSLKEKLTFTLVNDVKLPFEDSSFDIIYMSEVLPMIADPKEFLSEAKRVLTKNGKIIISNGAGHPKIREYFSKRSGFLWNYTNLRYKHKMPNSYQEYENILQKSFKTAQSKFLLLEDIQEMLNELDMVITKVDYTPKNLAGSFFSWTQYLNYLKNAETYAQHRFVVKYFLLSFLSLFESKKHFGGLLIESKRK